MLLASLRGLLRQAGHVGSLDASTLPAAAALAGPYSLVHSNKQRGFCSADGNVDFVDCVVVGAGVIGLACARAVALAGYETLILEKEPSWGTETSSRHSEVIHAGIYYPAGSLKAKYCVEGKHMLYDYCKQKGINHQNIGKLIVAHREEQIPKLQQLKQFAAANGVPDLQLLSAAEAVALEPALSAAAALLSPSTGIIDSHGYMEALLTDAVDAGAVLATHSKVLGIKSSSGTFSSSSSSSGTDSSSSTTLGHRRLVLDVQDTTTGESTQISTRWLINAAGLHAQAVAAAVADMPRAAIPKQYLAKGNYFSLSGKAPFSRLIYPLPEDGGLGVHLTLDLAGQAKFGPDVEWIDCIDYTVDPKRSERFYPAIRSYYPGLADGSLQPSYSGIRPKISGPGQPAADFVIQGYKDHGVMGLVNLFGLESPGLTSSLAIGQAVLQTLVQQ